MLTVVLEGAGDGVFSLFFKADSFGPYSAALSTGVFPGKACSLFTRMLLRLMFGTRFVYLSDYRVTLFRVTLFEVGRGAPLALAGGDIQSIVL